MESRQENNVLGLEITDGKSDRSGKHGHGELQTIHF